MTAELQAPVAELAYAMVSNTIAERHVGSNPTGGTKLSDLSGTIRGVHDRQMRAAARQRVAAGQTTVEVARELGASQSAVWRWANREFVSDTEPTPCWRCGTTEPSTKVSNAYAYLLGQ